MTKREKELRALLDSQSVGYVVTNYYDAEGKQPRLVTNMKNGKRNGEQISYYRNGNIRTISPFLNDKLEGCEKDFKEDGNLWIETDYSCGKKVECRVYENNEVVKRYIYKRGKYMGCYEKGVFIPSEK